MIKKIRYMLKMKGYLKLNDVSDIISYLLYHINKIDLYSNKYINVYLAVLEQDIIKYTSVMTGILNQKLDENRVIVKDVSEGSFKHIEVMRWYSIDECYLSGNDALNKFLSLILNFALWYENNKYSKNNIVSYNHRKLTPYYYNIKSIVDEIKARA